MRAACRTGPCPQGLNGLTAGRWAHLSLRPYPPYGRTGARLLQSAGLELGEAEIDVWLTPIHTGYVRRALRWESGLAD